jgi:DinB superfamily
VNFKRQFFPEAIMKRLTLPAILAIAFIFAASISRAQTKPAQSTPAQAPTPAKPATPAVKKPTLAAAIQTHWKFVAAEFISAADAMPDDKYSFVPTNGEFKGARTFAEQVRHVACANFAFFKEIEKLPPPPDCEKGEPANIQTKADLMTYLGQSFAYGETVIAKVNSLNMTDPVEGRYAGPNTKIGMCITAVWHVSDHYGQLVEYLRMNGIVPPASR